MIERGLIWGAIGRSAGRALTALRFEMSDFRAPDPSRPPTASAQFMRDVPKVGSESRLEQYHFLPGSHWSERADRPEGKRLHVR